MPTGNEETASRFRETFEKDKASYKRWLQYADRLLKFKTGGRFARCYTAEDIVYEIISKTLTGVIKWDTGRVPSLNTFMFYQVKSSIANIYKKENNLVHIYNEEEGDEEEYRDLTEYLNPVKKEDFENRMDAEEVIGECRKELDGDDEAGIVFEEILKGNFNREISRDYGLSINRVETIKTRIKRKLDRVFRVYYKEEKMFV
jgi:RNA polymerase sigma factor (sigma-70 family)